MITLFPISKRFGQARKAQKQNLNADSNTIGMPCKMDQNYQVSLNFRAKNQKIQNWKISGQNCFLDRVARIMTPPFWVDEQLGWLGGWVKVKYVLLSPHSMSQVGWQYFGGSLEKGTRLFYFWLDVVQVQKMAKKAKNPCRCSKISLHKKFKLILEQNVTEQTYPKISCRSQKCLVQTQIQQFYLVNWFFFSNVFWTDTFRKNVFYKLLTLQLIKKIISVSSESLRLKFSLLNKIDKIVIKVDIFVI